MTTSRFTIVAVISVVLVSTFSTALAEDLIPFDPAAARVQQIGGRWKITVGSMSLKDFGSHRGEAFQALRVIRHYRLNQQGFVGRPGPSTEYYLASGQAPVGPMPGEDAIAFNPATVQVRQYGGRWKLVDGSHWILDFAGRRDEALEARRIVRRYGFNRICFVGRPNASMTYFRIQPAPGPAARNWVRITSVVPGTNATLPVGRRLAVNIAYRLGTSAEGLIFARPHKNGHLAAGYAAHGSQTFARGSGTTSGWFTFNAPADIDEVRVELQDKHTHRVLATARLRVTARWVRPVAVRDSIRALHFNPSTTATLRAGQRASVQMSFRAVSSGQVLAFARPYTNGNPTPGYRAHPSATFGRGPGTATGWFFFDRPAWVNEVRLALRDKTTGRVLAERRYSVQLVWTP